VFNCAKTLLIHKTKVKQKSITSVEFKIIEQSNISLCVINNYSPLREIELTPL